MREIVDSEVLVMVMSEDGQEAHYDPALVVDFTNEIHWPLFVTFLKDVRSINYDDLELHDQTSVCIDATLLTEFLRSTPRLSFFRGRFYFYTLPLADATNIELYELSTDDVLSRLNNKPAESLGFLGRLRKFFSQVLA